MKKLKTYEIHYHGLITGRKIIKARNKEEAVKIFKNRV